MRFGVGSKTFAEIVLFLRKYHEYGDYKSRNGDASLSADAR